MEALSKYHKKVICLQLGLKEKKTCYKEILLETVR